MDDSSKLLDLNTHKETNLELQRRLQEANLEIDKLKKEKNDLIKNFTHDFSNPIQIIGMTLESLEMRQYQNPKDAVQRMKKSYDLIVSILNDLRKQKSAS